jgi:hypothetical protein
MDIGRPLRIVEVEPVSLPLPIEEPIPVEEPVETPEPTPVEP